MTNPASPHPTWPDGNTFWRDKRVIVTGGTGFLGGFITERLQLRGVHEIITPRKQYYDLRDNDAVQQLLHDTSRPHPVDMIIHLAANVGGIGANRRHPAEFFYDNLMMGVQLFHESWKRNISKFVAIGTVCSYPKFAPVPFHEKDLWAGYPEETNAPYGLAKKMLMVQSEAYRQQYGFNSINLLPVNLYGPRDNFDLETSHVIPALIHKFDDAKRRGENQVMVWGDGSPTREFLYVEDAAEGILLAAERLNDSQPVNLGSHFEISIRTLVTTIARLTQFDGRIVWDTSMPNGQLRRKLDTSKAAQLFGFQSTMPFETGLQHTIDWYRGQISDGLSSDFQI